LESSRSRWLQFVKDSRAFTVVAREVDGVPTDVLLALDALTGQELWSAPFTPSKYDGSGNAGVKENSGGDGPRSTPAVDEKRVYVLTADLLLSARDVATGQEVWKRDLLKEHSGQNISWKNAASPVLDGNLIFVGGGGEGQALLALDKTTGEVVWKAESDKITHASPTVASIAGVRQVIFLTQKGLVALLPTDGTVLWRHPFRFSVSTAASPIVAGEIVYCSAGYGVGATAVAVTRKGSSFAAAELWRVTGNSLANHWSTPVQKDGCLYGMFQFKEYAAGPLKCVELSTGKVKWSQPGFGPGQVILVGGKLVVLGDAGQVAIVDPAPDRYKESARFQAVEGKCWSTPAFSNGILYVRSTREAAAYELSQKVALR